MPIVALTGLVTGLLATFPEARRLYRRHGILLAGLIWPVLSAIVAAWIFAATVNDQTSPVPPYFHAWHGVMIVVAPVAVTVILARKYNVSAGVVGGGIVLACTFSFWVSMLFGYGTSAAAYGS
ncbi:hypothetical protein D0Y60_09030 [Shinella sp. WSJ-2]|uniref:hypothetical protein n=1 Tax=Shinella sp. WSJ-2 TaxID=2303749 RepID=UPI000E3BA4BB|nr:hypothetical protein [Shinella sp. WSJ-2]RFZ87991.1 hypothetical protein D0Y60_09030 [Shinella sp. WSJ-2]